MEDRFLKPETFTFSHFTTDQDVRYRAGFMPAIGTCKGQLILLYGFTEFIEKYFETIQDFANAGYDVHTMDWRGQGKSDRYDSENPTRVGNIGFEHDVKDLLYFLNHIVPKTDTNLPRYGVAHSMGGHLLSRALIDRPHLFKAVSLSAPMFAFRFPMPRWVANLILGTLKLFGKLATPVSGSGGGWAHKCPAIEKDPRSRDEARRLVHYHYCDQDPDLRLGAVTFEWVYHALKSVVYLNTPATLAKIGTPMLIATAENDTIVDNTVTRTAVQHLKNARFYTAKDAQHEIMMERDIIRAEFFAKTIEFFDKNR